MKLSTMYFMLVGTIGGILIITNYLLDLYSNIYTYNGLPQLGLILIITNFVLILILALRENYYENSLEENPYDDSE